ncbi:nitrogen fixation protein NifZ [Halorhodospira halochloris]|uniref:NifZ protein n=1 Tax=Halorhodospira halochloris TaxID=1052 RepID=A0A120MZV4_HALHR|nr:nitrogen fixation protein NifZ [Halorhodospira halochloris]MBK1652637.1 nitrogen fixation protein NifZ [Halorhodospira halochloris]MCG5530522.1 nitrogen fixation protein NifZ [Halorhodospira halochloris]MCG5548820.1 nitrogen fixation protein NifZ [Halorhodospira halochloris]BAU57911.1 NifZ protein [Halorhodospira halochloris]
MQRQRFELGAAVRVVRNVRDDGTYPGAQRGELLVRRGSVGYVREVGTFLQDQIIYSVDFPSVGKIVGCREEELIDPLQPWVECSFEAREQVTPKRRLAIDGAVVAEPGMVGEILQVLRDHPQAPAYHVRFPGRTLLVPERSLESVEAREGEAV